VTCRHARRESALEIGGLTVIEVTGVGNNAGQRFARDGYHPIAHATLCACVFLCADGATDASVRTGRLPHAGPAGFQP
jgi:hypothetical protein